MSQLNDVIFTFYHIEKCAGTSFRYALYNYFKNFINEKNIYIPDLLKERIMNNSVMNCYDLQTINSYNKFLKLNIRPQILLCHCRYNENNLTNTIPQNCFKFSVIRSPYNRFISEYNFFIYPQHNKTLNDLNDIELSMYVQKLSCNITNYFSGNTNNLELAKKNLSSFNFVLDFEDINNINIINKLNEKLNKHFNVNYKLNLPSNKYNASIKNYKLNDIIKQKIINQIKQSNDYKLYIYFKLNKYKIQNK